MKKKIASFYDQLEEVTNSLQKQFNEKQSTIVSLFKLNSETTFAQNTIFVNIGLSFSNKGYKTLLVDFDGKYDYSKKFGGKSVDSWENVWSQLANTQTVERDINVISATTQQNMYVLSVLNNDNSIFEIGKPAVQKKIKEFKSFFDLILINMPIDIQKMAPLSRMIDDGDVAVLVVKKNNIYKKEVKEWDKSIGKLNAKRAFILID